MRRCRFSRLNSSFSMLVAKTNASSVTFQKSADGARGSELKPPHPRLGNALWLKAHLPFVRFCTLREGRWLDQRFMRERITEKRSSVQTDSKLGSMTVQINRPQCRSAA